ncbi:MAG: CueP family metal-binding protein [Alphaproteobacteria bacterium]
MNKLQTIASAIIISTMAMSASAKNITPEEFAKLSPRDAITLSHDWHGKKQTMVAATPNGIEATFKNGQKVTIPLQDEFFVSVAPYIKRTHECAYHVPTGCTGELVGKKMQLKITDKATGEVIRDEDITTQKDGFVDLWLPKEKEFLVEFTYKGKKASQVLATNKDSHTCITTMQLK